MNQRHRFYTYRENKNGETVRVRCGKNSGYPVWCDCDICAEEERQEYKKRSEAELTTPPNLVLYNWREKQWKYQEAYANAGAVKKHP